MTDHDPTAERVARNDAIFRAANEGIAEAARAYGAAEPLPFICECADPKCTEIIRVAWAEYEAIRSNPARFLNAPGHNAAGGKFAAVVDRREGYEVVEKQGEARDIVVELDPNT